MFAAGEREFKQRFWIIGGVYWAAFACYWVDHRNAASAIARALSDGHAIANQVRVVLCLGAALAILAAALRTWATAYLRPEVMVDGKLHSSSLVADGPYRFVRNPLYLGNMLMAVGYAPMVSRLGAVLLILGNLIVILRLIGREEQALTADQGASYAAYTRAVPRLIPSLRPRVPAANHPFSLGAGLLGELFFWGLAAGSVAFAATMTARWLYYTLAVAFTAYFASWFVIKRRAHRAVSA